ncbi:hypothetical protein JK636_15030 [Clostridium sp. YIM B02515]|uniref:Uncharacterized protein n=1 Tax=Clostridium rhizosphaerae TaxID=2803861 RepID=A0ABS1TCI4_9CLOT|nr:hypothetical protein [Clostridium rhizosphaerae]MBL4937066.1 hypothetical protein [Clostridium rhizosphaerae]
MKYKRTISLLIGCIIILSVFASLVGIFSNAGSGVRQIESFRGETIKIYGKGLYSNDSVAVAAQGIAQDIITVALGIPLIIVSLYRALKDSLRGRLLLTGTLGYFLYTYISYVFLWMYNPMFIVYVMLISASFFAFTLLMMSFDIKNLSSLFNKKLPVKFLGGFQIFFAAALWLLWMGKIIPTITNGAVPVGLEHYTTLVIQGLDLGFIVPIALLSGVLLIKRKPFGYLLSSVIIMKGFTMGAALTAMIISQYIAGVSMGIIEIIMFPMFSLVIFYCMILLLKNINGKGYA